MGTSRLLMTIWAASLGAGAITAPVAGRSADRAEPGAGQQAFGAAAMLRQARPAIGFAFGVEAAQRRHEHVETFGGRAIGESQRAYLGRWLLCTPRHRSSRRDLTPSHPYRGGSRGACQTKR
jgi:hypothetical protein